MQYLLSVVWVSVVFHRLTLEEGGESDLFSQVHFLMVLTGKKNAIERRLEGSS